MASPAITRVLFGGATISTLPGEIGLTFLCMVAGLTLALGHGLGKMPPSAGFVSSVGDMGLPLPTLFAWAAGLSELVGGILLAIGLMTRPAAAFILITMSVAVFVRHADDPFSAKERALLFGCIALMFMLMGAGRLSVDRLLR